MRNEFEKNRYWVGIYRTDVDFDETLGNFGRYVGNGSRRIYTEDLEAFNEKWEVFANAWSLQQKKLDEVQNNFNTVVNIATELAEYTSYAEIAGGIKINREPIREYCNKVFDFNSKLGDEDWE